MKINIECTGDLLSLNIGDFFSGNDTGLAYEVLSIIASGGFGTTLRLHREDGITCVGKIPMKNDYARKCLIKEYEVLCRLRDRQVPYIIRPIERGDYTDSFGQNVIILVMELAEGETLESILAGGAMVDHATTVEIISKIGEGLIGVHKAGFIHRDISPDNLFIEDYGGQNIPIIIDFGIAAALSEKNTTGWVSQMAGKPYYSPPEQLKTKRAGPGNDIFSLGATAVEMLIGPNPKNQGHQSPFDVHQTDASIAQHSRDVLLKATWGARSGRFATMQDMISAFSGKIPDESVPRIVADGNVFRMEGPGPWIIGRFGFASDIQVHETSTTGGPYISREHAQIEARIDGSFRISNLSLNGIRVFHHYWRDVDENQGFPLGSRYQEICLGYTTDPPKDLDINGDPLIPGPYKTIEFFPAKPNV